MLRRFQARLIDLTLPTVDGLALEMDLAARVHAKEFVVATIELAPHHVRLGAKLMVLALWLWTLPAGGLPPKDEGRRWRWARLFTKLPGPCGMIFRLYGNLAAFAYFDHPDVARHLGLTPSVDRQAAYREKAGGRV